MTTLKRFFSSSIGRKVIMTLSGLALIIFVIGHLLGNLQVFLGQDQFNHYAEFLKSMPGPIWAARTGLLVIFATHIALAFKLRAQNAAARPNGYAIKTSVKADPASLYMLESGIVILIFVVIHLLHFTFGSLQSEYFELRDPQGRHDVYSMLVHGFQNLGYSITYITAMFFLGFHLSHAISSMFQTLGLNHKKYFPCIKQSGKVIAWTIALAYMSIPLSVLTGIIGLP